MSEEIIACIKALNSVKDIIGELEVKSTPKNVENLYSAYGFLNAIQNTLAKCVEEKKEGEDDAAESKS